MPRALTKDIAWIVGRGDYSNTGVIIRTTDGGASWESQPMPEQASLWGLSIVGVR